MRVLWVSFIIVVCDQLTKLTVLKTMTRSRSINVIGDWFKLTYTENPGMAFGVEFGPPAMISILSIIATLVIVGYLFSVRASFKPYRVSLALVLGGALGNIIDRVLYGRVFYDLPLFQGRVVDFLHLDVWRGFLPEWLPFFGGRAVALFPIGNIADVAIIAGVVGIIWYQKQFHESEIALRLGEGGEQGDADAGDVPVTTETVTAVSAAAAGAPATVTPAGGPTTDQVNAVHDVISASDSTAARDAAAKPEVAPAPEAPEAAPREGTASVDDSDEDARPRA